MSDLKSYKPYARIITILSGLVLFISVLDANQLITIFPEYTRTINIIIALAVIIAPALTQEARVSRAEYLATEKQLENMRLTVDDVEIPNKAINIKNDKNKDYVKVNINTEGAP